MKYRRLGRSGLPVSAVGLGTWLTFGKVLDDARATAIVRRAFDAGVNLFDTADVYARGAAEEQLGRILGALPRREYVLATKCYFPMTEAVTDRGLSRKHIVESCRDSLRRLGTDHIDLYQCHRTDPDVPLDETLAALDDLARWGDVLYVGVSEWPANTILEAVAANRDAGRRPIVSNQPCYNLLERDVERTVLPACEAHGIGLLAFSPLAQGVLTGKYRKGAPMPAGSRGADARMSPWIPEYLTDDTFRILDGLRPIAANLGISPAVLALAWCLRLPAVSSVIVGATRPEQVDENVRAAGVTLPSEALQAIDALLARP